MVQPDSVQVCHFCPAYLLHPRGPWVDEQLPRSAPDAAMTEAWDNTLAGVYELALNNDPMLAMAEASYRVGLEQRKLPERPFCPKRTLLTQTATPIPNLEANSPSGPSSSKTRRTPARIRMATSPP